MRGTQPIFLNDFLAFAEIGSWENLTHCVKILRKYVLQVVNILYYSIWEWTADRLVGRLFMANEAPSQEKLVHLVHRQDEDISGRYRQLSMAQGVGRPWLWCEKGVGEEQPAQKSSLHIWSRSCVEEQSLLLEVWERQLLRASIQCCVQLCPHCAEAQTQHRRHA